MRDDLGRFKKQEKNEIEVFENYALVWTTNKNGEKKQAYKIDLQDIDKVCEYRWSVNTDGYAKSNSIKMHRLILDAQNGQIVDHINQDVTDNRRANLRFVTNSLNQRNSSKTKNKTGEKHIIKMGKVFTVQLVCRGKRYYIGNMKTKEEAIQKRNELYKEIKYFDE